MRKETETEETTDIFVTFLSLVSFQLGGGGLPGYAYELGVAAGSTTVLTIFTYNFAYK